MAKRQAKKAVAPESIGIRISGDKLQVDLDTEYREAAGLQRVEALLGTDRGFCLVSCFQASRAFRDNQNAFMRMPKAMQTWTGQPELGGFWLIAHWIEAGVAGDCLVHSLEYSWLFVQPQKLDDAAWLEAATLTARTHQQAFFLLRKKGDRDAVWFGADGERERSLSGAEEILSAAKFMTYLRSRDETWGKPDPARLFDEATRPIVDLKSSSFVVHRASIDATTMEPKPMALYAATPHCNSSRWFFSVLKAWKGG